MLRARLLPVVVLSVSVAFGVSPSFAQRAPAPTAEEPDRLTADTHDVLPVDRVAAVALDAIDIDAVLVEDEQRAAEGLAPRYAIPMPTFITPDVDGTWEDLDGQTRMWRLRITSPDALSLNLGFTRYHLPAGASLFLYATDFSYVLRPFTDGDNAEHGEFWTPVVLADDVVLELIIPADVVDQLALELTSINVGYRGFGEVLGLRAGACNNDVVCPEGDPWRDEIPSVGVISTGGSTFCTGFMVNNTAQDETPYFMTANHCGISAGNAASLVVYWNFESPNCGQQSGGSLSQWQSGSFFRAARSTSDFTLVELDQAPNPAWNVTFAGWDRTSADATSAVAIHHPNTDEKSISFEYDPTTTTSYLSNAVPGDGTHVRVTDWDDGTTEPGSSGSPLFDQNHRVVGQLHGGYASCSSQTSDWYGRFSVSWTGGGSAATRLSDWLDPGSTGLTVVDTLVPGASGLRVTPSGGLNSVGDPGGPFAPASIVYTLENRGGAAINYSVTKGQTWVSVSSASGSLGSLATTNVTVSINANANSLTQGVYADTVNFINTTDHVGDTTRNVNLQVGGPQLVYSFPMDTDPGWTTQGLWAFGKPTGAGGQYGGPDPTSGFTGNNVYGYNLSGDYENNLVQRHLTSSAIDCSNLAAVTLKFRRWLGVEQPLYDHAYVRVSNNGSTWTTIWENSAVTTDAAWSLQEFDISSVADGQPAVYLRWTMGTTDGSWQYCGWNIDDVEIHAIVPSTPGVITGARSCRTHGAVGQLCLDLAAGEVEPRQGGVELLVFDVSQPASSVAASVNCANNVYSGAASATGNGATVDVVLNPAAPDADCCTVTLTGDVQDSFAVRTLAGDIDRDGTVATTDASIIKPLFGATPDAASAVYDFDCSGTIATTDFSLIKPLFGRQAPACP